MLSSPGSVALSLGPVTIRWYGLLIGLGILFAYLYLLKESHRRKLKAAVFDDMAIFVIMGGVIGARLYYVLFNLSYYIKSPIEIIKVWHGGLAIHGALLGGALAFYFYTRKHKLDKALYLDIILPGVLLAQAVGRFGNFFNNEAFGTPTDLPWKLFIPESARPPELASFEFFHPTFLYEFAWNITGFFLLTFLSSHLYKTPRNSSPTYHIPHTTYSVLPGHIACAYFIWYSFGRFFIEILRTDSLYLGPLKAAQVASVILFFAGVFGLLFLRRRGRLK